MKWILLTLLLIFFVPICSAEDINLGKDRLDTYFLYTGLGEPQTSEYRFVSSGLVSTCEMIPNDNASCVIENEYIVKIHYTTTGDPYEGTLKVVSETGAVGSAAVLIRVYDFGISLNTPAVKIGDSANSSAVKLFFNTSDDSIIGIRLWIILWMFILLGILLMKVYL